MTRPVPPADVLLQAAARYLEDELLPTLDGYHRFQTRVAVNVLRIVERELRLSGANTQAEQARLAALLGRDGDAHALSQALADAIRDGRMPLDTPGLAEHLRQTLRETLTVHNPKWAATPQPVPPSNPRSTP